MVNFNNLTEGEKFAFSKEFLVRFKVVKKLKPDLDEEKDILELVADKFYGGNINVLEDAIRFIESKTPISSLDTVNLDGPATEYFNSLATKEGEFSKERDKKDHEWHDKEKEYHECLTCRNKARGNEDKMKAKITRHKIKSVLIISALALVGIGLLGYFGGVVGLVNTAIAFVGNLSFVQASTLFLLIYGGGLALGFIKGKSAPLFDVKGKYKGFKDKRKNKRDEDFKHSHEEREKLDSRSKELEAEVAKLKKEASDAHESFARENKRVASEKSKLETYQKTSNFDRGLSLSSISIKEQYNKVRAKLTTDSSREDLDGWYRYFDAALYYGAFKGEINTKEDMKNIVAEAKAKFEQILDPLKMNKAYNDDNVRARTDSRTNKPLEEMFEAI